MTDDAHQNEYAVIKKCGRNIAKRYGITGAEFQAARSALGGDPVLGKILDRLFVTKNRDPSWRASAKQQRRDEPRARPEHDDYADAEGRTDRSGMDRSQNYEMRILVEVPYAKLAAVRAVLG